MASKTVIIERLNWYKGRLALYLEAEEAVLTGAQRYRIGSRDLTRADLHEIRTMITSLENNVEALESQLAGYGQRRCVRGLPRDI